MQENTVVIEIKEYNKLRDFYKGITEKKFVEIDSHRNKVYFHKEGKMYEECYNIAIETEKINNRYIKEIDELKLKLKEKSFWGFLNLKNKR